MILPTGFILYKAGENIVETSDKAQKDPPDRRFRVYAKVKRTPRVTIRSGAASRAAARRRSAGCCTAQLAAAATGKALGATIDKAGGALKAKNRTWQGRQVRLARRYATTFARQLGALPGLRAKAARAVGRAPQFARAPSRRAVLKAQARVRRDGLPRRLVTRLKRLGFDAADLRNLRRAAGKAKLDGDLTPLRLLTEPKVDDGYRASASYFRIWLNSPQVIAASRLK